MPPITKENVDETFSYHEESDEGIEHQVAIRAATARYESKTATIELRIPRVNAHAALDVLREVVIAAEIDLPDEFTVTMNGNENSEWHSYLKDKYYLEREWSKQGILPW